MLANIYIFIYIFYNSEFSQYFELCKFCCIIVLINFSSSQFTYYPVIDLNFILDSPRSSK
jgi:hypothetical protein